MFEDLAARALVGDALFSSAIQSSTTRTRLAIRPPVGLADCVLNGGVSANTFDAANEANQFYKVSKWISKMKSLIPKLSRIEAECSFVARPAQNWYNQEAHARAMGESIGGDRVKFNEIEID